MKKTLCIMAATAGLLFANLTIASAGSPLFDIVRDISHTIPGMNLPPVCGIVGPCKRLPFPNESTSSKCGFYAPCEGGATSPNLPKITGTYCATRLGLAGPGPEAPFGSPCHDMYGNEGLVVRKFAVTE